LLVAEPPPPPPLLPLLMRHDRRRNRSHSRKALQLAVTTGGDSLYNRRQLRSSRTVL
jgi:hypothetical protein